jgi:DNA-binding transcriptional MerR regulator
MPMDTQDAAASFLRAGEVARLTGVSSDTLRHYERKGVVPRPCRSENNYRQYPASVVDRVRLVQRALALGFTLDELALLLAERDKGGAPCQKVKALAEAKLAALESHLRELMEMRDDLQALLAEWNATLSRTKAGERAYLLSSLVEQKQKRSNSQRRSSKARALAPSLSDLLLTRMLLGD